MDIIIGLLMGCGLSTVVGTGIYRSALEKQRRGEGSRLEQLRLELNRAHESELQQTIAGLKTEYLQQSQEKERQLKQDYQRQLAAEIAPREEAEKALIARAEEIQQAIAAREREVEQKIAQIEAKHSQDIAQIEDEHARSIEQLKAQKSSAPAPQPVPTAIPASPPAIKSSESKPPVTDLRETNLVELLAKTYDPDPALRQQAALAIGNIATGQKVRGEIERAIPVLGKLSRDARPDVRLAAVTALAQINSREVIPYLQRALNDSDRNAIVAASEAIAKFKRHTLQSVKPIPKNAAAQQDSLV